MNSDIFYQNEIEYARSVFLKNKPDFSHYVIIGEENNYLVHTLKDTFSSLKVSFSCNFQGFSSDNFCVIISLYNAKQKEKLLEYSEKFLLTDRCRKCIIIDENSLDANDEGLMISEREYNFLCNDKTVFEKVKVFSKSVQTVLLRTDEIIGPGYGFENELEQITSSGKVEISPEDDETICGYTYIRDALTAIMLSFSNLKSGNVYNVSSFAVSQADIKYEIHKLFKDKFSLECSLDAEKSRKTKALCPLKLKSVCSGFTDIETAVYAIASAYFGYAYDYDKNLTQYCAKLDILKRVELNILGEIDRVCKKHNIKYFLTGGTLLGAVRYGKSIPWDDDLDIGMLREDFEKFRKVCPMEIDNTKFAYASYATEPDCHYLFDKIRLKNTYFSTAFSSKYRIQDGVFVDIFVYDRTSKSRKMQSLHINLVKCAIRFMNIKWTGKADKNMNGYLLSALLKPFLRFASYKTLHAFSEKALRCFEKKDSGYLIDGTGLNINRGAFKKSCLENLTETEFEGFIVPIPQNYDEFLKHVYGENYLKEPPLYQRNGTHDFVRLDLGEYILENNYESDEQSLDGELF